MRAASRRRAHGKYRVGRFGCRRAMPGGRSEVPRGVGGTRDDVAIA